MYVCVCVFIFSHDYKEVGPQLYPVIDAVAKKS